MLAYFELAFPRLLSGTGRSPAGGPECAHPAAFPVQFPECRAVADSRPAAAGRGGIGIAVRSVPRRHARSGELVSLADEIALANSIWNSKSCGWAIGLSVDWQIGPVSLDLPIPPLMLQPLLENAVYHGIEPAPEGGTVRIAIGSTTTSCVIAIANPTAGHLQHAAGNQIALANIRERLALYYDLEARLETEAGAHTYEVRIILPCNARKPSAENPDCR
jgi:hypothetical protein